MNYDTDTVKEPNILLSYKLWVKINEPLSLFFKCVKIQTVCKSHIFMFITQNELVFYEIIKIFFRWLQGPRKFLLVDYLPPVL